MLFSLTKNRTEAFKDIFCNVILYTKRTTASILFGECICRNYDKKDHSKKRSKNQDRKRCVRI